MTLQSFKAAPKLNQQFWPTCSQLKGKLQTILEASLSGNKSSDCHEMFATISSGFDLPLRGKWDQQQPPKPDVDAVFARLARCVVKVFLDTRLACAFTPIVTYSTHFGKLEGTSSNPSFVKVTKDYRS